MSPTRRLFQIHLSTAVVLMLIAGALMRANVGHQKKYIVDYDFEGNRSDPILADYREIGFPWNANSIPIFYKTHSFPSATLGYPCEVPEIKWKIVALNIGFAIVSLLSAAIICEWHIRRRAVPPLTPLTP